MLKRWADRGWCSVPGIVEVRLDLLDQGGDRDGFRRRRQARVGGEKQGGAGRRDETAIVHK